MFDLCLYFILLTDVQNHRYRVGNRNWMAINAHTRDCTHELGLNMILASMALNCVVVKFPHFYRMNTKIHRCHVLFLCGRSRMWAMKNGPYRLHSHLRMALEPKNKMPKVRTYKWLSSLNLYGFPNNKTEYVKTEQINYRQSGDIDTQQRIDKVSLYKADNRWHGLYICGCVPRRQWQSELLHAIRSMWKWWKIVERLGREWKTNRSQQGWKT